MKDIDGKRYCDRCGVLLDSNNNKCGFELCDKCNEELERRIKRMTIEEINKDICFAKMVIGAINNVKTPMLMYDEEKAVVKKALSKYLDELESELRGR